MQNQSAQKVSCVLQSPIWDMLKPNVASLGYGLFLAINAASVWGGVFPFLPLEFQSTDIVFWFFLSQSLVFSASFLASMLGSYFFPKATRAFLVQLTTAPYLLGWCALIGAIYLDHLSLVLVIIGGALLGLSSAGFYMLWQRLFASMPSETGDHNLIRGTVYGAVFYFSLYLIPGAVTAFLIPLVFLPLFALAIVLKSRSTNFNQPMFEDVPREHPHVYRRVIKDYWRSALCVGSLGFCTGIMRALAIGNPSVGSLVNALSMGATLVAALVLLFVWRQKDLHMNVVSAFRTFFPFVITSFLLLPFLPGEYERWLAAILYAIYSVAIMVMMIQCAQASRNRGINPVFIYGFFGCIIYVLHDIGFLGGTFAETIRVTGIAPLAVVALVAMYLLGLMYFVGQGGFKRIFSQNGWSNIGEHTLDERAASIELVALSPKPSHEKPHGSKRHKGEDLAVVYQDRMSKQAALVQRHYRLSARETEVMELIARGNTVSRIAEELVVSENTIRTHSKRIYTKLGIHKKQELLDLIDSFDPAELQD